jgi:hypothetical protein
MVLYFISFTLLELLIFINQEMKTLQILQVQGDDNLRSLTFIMGNENLLINEELFHAIFNTLMNREDFINFGFRKIIILSCVLDNGKEVNIHPNTLFDNETTFEDSYKEITTTNDGVKGYNNLEHGYSNQTIVRFIVKVWTCSHYKNVNIGFKHDTLTLPIFS